MHNLMHIHKESLPGLEKLGEIIPEYQPTFDFSGEYIDRFHRHLATSPLDDSLIVIKDKRWSGSIIQGWLRREDALKLYEIAYFVHGDILELGPYHGLSTSILAQANHNSPYHKQIFSVDIDPDYIILTRQHLHTMRLDKNVKLICADASTAVDQWINEEKKFEFVFIDHSHSYQPVYEICLELQNIVSPGGFCLFLDFNDIRNKDSENPDYGVYHAVIDGLDENQFEFYGVYGCTALYRAKLPQ
jgi:hypothetical protein